MLVNADFDQPVALHTTEMEWSPSPIKGVKRRMLDRIGGEVARATSIVRYAPGSAFSEHTHSGGEEFIVLEGVFQDEHGDYPAGTYVRNPVGTHHVPRSETGCTIFVKLWQFDPADQKQFSIDLEKLSPMPVEGLPGVSRARLHEVNYEVVWLEDIAPSVRRGFAGSAGAELLVLDGSVQWRGDSYDKHSWLRFPPDGEEVIISGERGARLWIKTGHLGDVSAPDA